MRIDAAVLSEKQEKEKTGRRRGGRSEGLEGKADAARMEMLRNERRWWVELRPKSTLPLKGIYMPPRENRNRPDMDH